MCGIFGYINWDVKQEVSEEKLIEATNVLFHRGPDGGGYYYDPPFFLAHRRLSIIDIQGGEQPLFSCGGRYGIVFNGEIYNYIELKEELQKLGHEFKTKSDTEVILNGYIQWGEKICKKLIGMFAFAIHDRFEKTLFLSRDRMGEKPLFYFNKNGAFSFASEIKSLSYVADFPLEIDQGALSQYLMLNYVPSNHTLIKDMYKLQPGNWMLISSDKIMIEQYWTAQSTQLEKITTLDQAITQLEPLLNKSIEIGSRSDVPITLALSGGIDSSLVGYYAAMQGSLTEAYCVDFEEKGFSEYPQAKIVADKLGIKLNAVPFSSHFMEEFLNIVYHADDPLADSSSLAVWALSKNVSQKYKVMLGGDGGDEIFGGYLTYKASLMYQNIFKYMPTPLRLSIQKLSHILPISDKKVSFSYKLMRFLRAFDLAPEEAHFTWNGTWHPHEVNKISSSIPENKEGNILTKQIGTHKDVLTTLQKIDLENYLPSDILTKVDRMTMAHGLESRAPLLHPDIVNFGLSLPSKFKISQDGQLKYILRMLVERKFGKSISTAKKQGFSIPVNQWLRKEAKGLLTDSLSPETLHSIPFLNSNFITKAVQDHITGKKQLGFELWGLMVLVSWYKQKVEKPYYVLPKARLNKVNLPNHERCVNE
jgi:asparagine synthase (glutamine-hydrolysing)